MAPSFKDDAHLIILPGSLHTLVRFGLEDAITPPTYSIPTKVYRNPNQDGCFQATAPVGSEGDPESYAVYPIVRGEIVNVDALNFLFKCVLRSVLKDNPLVLLDSITFTLIQSSSRWSPVALEMITNYAFETLQLAAFAVVPAALCSLFAHGSFSSACVIDVGYEKCEISPIVDFQVFAPAVTYLEEGGKSINKRLHELLPELSDDQIESLKRSPIFECLSEEQAKGSYFGVAGLLDDVKAKNPEDEGVLDIASIVTSEKSTREILEEKEREKRGKSQKKKGKTEDEKSNSERENNQFVDNEGNVITVGKERFQGSGRLIENLSHAIFRALSKVPDMKKREECYENLVICGKTSSIKGFKEELLVQLYSKFVAGADIEEYEKRRKERIRQGASFRNEAAGLMDELQLAQAPKRVRVIPKPDYFSAWKKAGFEDCAFLGGEILCRQIFGGSGDNELYLSKEEYYDKGPMLIRHVKL